MSPPLVYTIILQYNNSQDTLRCLESLKELYPVRSSPPSGSSGPRSAGETSNGTGYPNFRVVVVDNASNEAEVNDIREYIKSQEHDSPQGRTFIFQGSTFLLENKENLGYAGGNNVGIKYALENNADYVFILNNDTTVEPDTLVKLVETAESDKNIGIVGPAIKENGKTAYFGKISWLKSELKHVYGKSEIHPLENCSSKVPTLGGGPTKWGAKELESLSRARSRGSRVGCISDFPYLGQKEYVIGAAMLIKKDVLEKIEGFDEIYFLYFEDADLNIRAQAAGYKLKIASEAVAHHQVSASTKKLGSPLILRYHMRNALIFNSLNAPWTVKPFLIFWAGYIVLKNILKIFLMPSKATAADATIEGVLDFYKNKFGKINA